MSNAVISHDLVGHHTVEILLQAGCNFLFTLWMLLRIIFSRYGSGRNLSTILYSGNMWRMPSPTMCIRMEKSKIGNRRHISPSKKKPKKLHGSAVDDKGYEGFASEPILIAKQIDTFRMWNLAKSNKITDNKFFWNRCHRDITTKNKSASILIVQKKGNIELILNTLMVMAHGILDNKCAIRSLLVNGQYHKCLYFLKVSGEWSNWGYSNKVISQGRRQRHSIDF